MFQELPEIQRLCSGIEQLQKESFQLRQALSRARPTNKKVEREVNNTIDTTISKTKQKLQLCQQMQKQIENQQFISSSFLVEDLIQDIKQLPEWFAFVFQKQFEKNKNSFSAMCKKLYKQHGLYEKKLQLANEVKSFQNMHKRYQSFNQVQRGCINIDSESQTFQNKTHLIIQRFVNFINLVGSKIMYFVEQNMQRSMNYSNKMNDYGQNRRNFDMGRQIYEQRVSSSIGFDKFNPNNINNEQNIRMQTQYEKPIYRSTMPTGFMVHHRHQSPSRCLNHHGGTYMDRHICQVHQRQPVYGNYMGNTSNMPLHSVGFNESRFNYRDHVPKWANHSLAGFYH